MKDDEGQSYLINAILRSYIEDNQYQQADKLVSRITFPDNVHNNQVIRYHYYLGRIT
jgi:26S proteasome regulatory subunit N3